MLSDQASATQAFSPSPLARKNDFSAVATVEPVPSRPVEESRQHGKGHAMVAGDQVVFARLDVAEALGIWRHAKGRVVGTHAEAPRGERVTVDVKFEGHDTLERYLPEVFEKRFN